MVSNNNNNFNEEFIEKRFKNHTECVINILYQSDVKDEKLSVSDITDKSDTNYNHCHDIISNLIDNGYAEKEESTGRSKPIGLTEKGRELAEIIHNKIADLDDLTNGLS